MVVENLCHCVCKCGCVSMKPPFSRNKGRGWFKGMPSIECWTCLTLEQAAFCKQDNCKVRVTAFARTLCMRSTYMCKKITIIYSHIHSHTHTGTHTQSHTQIHAYTLMHYILLLRHILGVYTFYM